MENLKIAFFCWESLYAERVGGLANAATNLAETLAQNHEVHFFTRGEGRDAEINGVWYHYCRPSGENIVRYCSDMSRKMLDRFHEFDAPSFDLLHFHDWHVVDALQRLRDRETVFTYHSTEFGRNGNNLSTGWPFTEITRIEHCGASIAKHITAVSSTLRQEAMSLYEIPDWKIDVVHNGIVPDHYQADVDPEAVKRRYGFDPESPLILFVGRLAWQKGPDMLVDAAPALLREHADGQFAFIGDGQMRRGLENRARTLPVRFLGRLSDADYVPLLNASDIVAIPSRNEPFGLVLLEAWSAGRCVVASDVGGLSENIEHGTDGVKVLPHPDSIARGLSRVADSPEKALAMGREGLDKVKKEFPWSRVGERMGGVYKKLAKHDTIPC
ncbi:glycosyltransferase family 4 protein [Methanoculleus sp. FWC-SCC3]|uniref:Glycosyltransferase family 4 protein n=1 Tax=Methanoculleus methanifontis TaxID=2584086 RepID=A0ABT8M313_9EURY|nr:glycosyltransferase family 4 protein [Methanoculleus sp. FWC-SCC3]MDN7013088.1 glycosyltransferase family 4 protein [Methanoculleus sp. FWC-SCC3]